MDIKDDIVYLDESQYKEVDTENEVIEQIADEEINNDLTIEEINLIIKLINEILNESDIYVVGLPMYSSNNYIRFKQYEESKLDELYLIKSILEKYKEINDKDLDNDDKEVNNENNPSEFLHSINDLLKKEKESKNQKIEVKKTKEEINLLILKNLISRFLKLHFKEKKTTLNERAKSDIEKTYGYYYWDKKKIARHLVTKEYTKILNDKYDMEYSKGKNESVPLAFYFDLSGSMNNYTTMLAQISYHLLKNKVKVLVGFNETIYYQINSINDNQSLEDLINFFESYKSTGKINYEEINNHIDEYLKEKLCEKCVVFSDNDSYSEVCELSKSCDVYLMYFKTYGVHIDENFKGCAFVIESEEDLFNSLREISKTNYQVLKQKSLKLKRRNI